MSLRGGVFHEFCRNQIFTPDVVIPSFKTELYCNNEIATLPSVVRNDKSFNVNKNNVTLNLFQGLSIGFSKIQSCINQIDRFRNKFGMTNLTKRCAFTLSELLLALIIVGVLAVITIPILLNNIQKKYFATQIKNFSAQIEQLAQGQLIKHRTRDLWNTDFAQYQKLLTNKYFKIVKSCSGKTATKDCWKTTATGNDKIIYKTLSKTDISSVIPNYPTLILKNGVMFAYQPVTAVAYRPYAVALIFVDINGNEKPNISGRDFFTLYVSPKGKIVDRAYVQNVNYSLSKKTNLCKNAKNVESLHCFGALIDNNWKMDY